MASNFQIFSFKSNNNLHLKLSGDFDVDSAQKLTNTLLSHGVGYRDIFVDTNNLETIHPFGRDALQMNLSSFRKHFNNLFFVGANKYKIEPT